MCAARARAGRAVDAGLDAESEAVAQGVDLRDHPRVTTPAHDVQHRAEDLPCTSADMLHLKGLWRNQIWY
jgi:hypothetical protein